MVLEQEREPNGHGEMDNTLDLAPPLEWTEGKRSWSQRLRAVTRPMRNALAEAGPTRWPTPVTIGLFLSVFGLLLTGFMWLIGLTLGAVYWGGIMTATVGQHERTLSTAGIAQLIATNDVHKKELADMREKFRKQEEYNDLVIIYENRVRELLVSLGVRQRDLPTMPKRPR